MSKNIIKIALKGIALAMGVAVIVMSTLKTLDVSAGEFSKPPHCVKAKADVAQKENS